MKTNDSTLLEASLLDREKAFRFECHTLFNGYTTQTLKQFCDYWTEKSPNSKKMRFEMQKVFDMKRRMATWVANKNKGTSLSSGANGFNTAN